MDGIETVDELLIRAKELSAEEQKKLRDVVEECCLREARMREASESAKRNLEELSRTFGMVVDTIASVRRAVDELHKEVEKLQLRIMPEEQFFTA